MTIEYRIKNIYGNDLTYPACETGVKFAELLGVKTFNATQLKQIAGLGYELKRVF